MLETLNRLYPIRYTAFGLCILGAIYCLLSSLLGSIDGWTVLGFLVFAGLTAVGFYDIEQSKRAILRNYPVIGHIRFGLEFNLTSALLAHNSMWVPQVTNGSIIPLRPPTLNLTTFALSLGQSAHNPTTPACSIFQP